MKVMLTGGGTAGHINPALAIAKHIKMRRPNAEILFVGATGGMEERLVTQAGFELKTYRVSGILRSFTPKAIFKNVRAMALLASAMNAAGKLVDEIFSNNISHAFENIALRTMGKTCPLFHNIKKLKKLR